jgi:hypothetical protein
MLIPAKNVNLIEQVSWPSQNNVLRFDVQKRFILNEETFTADQPQIVY